MASIPKAVSAATIINRAAAEVGVTPVEDPLASGDEFFVQIKYLLNSAGEELSIAHEWSFQNREHAITTSAATAPLGKYSLPTDFNYMINQSGWERTDNVPLFGPLSSQDWQYLLGRDLVSSTIYASFRLTEGQIWLFPQPPPDSLDIRFEYQSINWVVDPSDATQLFSEVTESSQIVQFDSTLISRYLKQKVLDAKGFDATSAQDDFNQVFSFLTGRDKGAEVLSAGRSRRGVPYLGYYNVPDTGFGA